MLKPSQQLQIELSVRSEGSIRYHNLKWFNKVYVDRKIEPRDRTTVEPFILGRLYTFFYPEPKYKDTLDFYSVIPVSMFIGYSKNAPENPMMVNIHYLPPKVRAVVFDKIFEINNSKIESVEKVIAKGNKSRRQLDTTYYDLQKYLHKSGYGFAIRSYIKERIKTEPIIISYPDWWRLLTFSNQHVVKKSIMEIYRMYKLKLDENWKPFKKEKDIKI